MTEDAEFTKLIGRASFEDITLLLYLNHMKEQSHVTTGLTSVFSKVLDRIIRK